jgi:soluble lytic murein transglycosylase-like protein
MQPIAKQRALGEPSPRPASFSFPAISCFPMCHRRTSRRRRFAARICVGIVLLSALSVRPVDAGAALPTASGAFESGDPFAAWIAEAARRFDIPAFWIRNVMRIESRGDARAVSPKGAIGLMQLMPETWADLRLRYGLGSDPFDPRDNILAGAAYLRELHDRFGDAGFLAAYNAGPARYEAFLATGRPLPDETRAYLGALAPLTAGSAAETRLAVPSEVRSWADAPLFVLLAAHSSIAHGLSSAVQRERRPAVARVADVTGFVAQSAGLFVAVSHQISTP